MNKANRKAGQIRTKARRLLAYALLTALASAAAAGVQAQTFAEFFSQKKKQKEYLLTQIAALQLYIGYAKKGYDIVGSGINTVKDIKNGEFGLHSAFFGSLKAVSPVIRNNSKVAEIIALQLAISKSLNGMKGNSFLSADNQRYIASVRANVLDECVTDLEELLLVITSGKVEMTEDERIKRLDRVYDAMRDKSAFTQHFTGQVQALAAQKSREQQSINHIRRLYENTENQ
ncbi:hypothetical protein GCM10022216_02420 [Sphingobacterium kyonggiense]|uniref:TerB family tellurite resistance protein n=1 Tax=Sphingobacterium kyonggiense TaxID=714075 RepID=A0ABP7Y7M9_9SPHI